MGTLHEYQKTFERSDRSAGDRQRHREKVRQAIKDNIADIIAEESIIGKSRDKIIKVPIRGVKEYKFVYGENTPGVGQGKGQTQPGDVVGSSGDDQGQGSDQAGDKPGEDYYETDVTLEELIDIVFEDLELPFWERKRLRVVESLRRFKRKGFRRKGIRPRLDKKRSAKARVRRKHATVGPRRRQIITPGQDSAAPIQDGMVPAVDEALFRQHGMDEAGEERFPFHEDDLKYRHLTEDVKTESNAVVICIMDTSGSMDTVKKYLARSFYFLLYQFVSMRYENTELVFIAHHTEAEEVNEDEFFHKGESGGTFVSSGYLKALEIIDKRYHPAIWNIYAFHCSDGDNFPSDNDAAIEAARQLCQVCNLFGYGEIKPVGSYSFSGTLFQLFRAIVADNFVMVKIERKEDLWRAFRQLISVDKTAATEETLEE
jgi:sporulation protein YhbH